MSELPNLLTENHFFTKRFLERAIISDIICNVARKHTIFINVTFRTPLLYLPLTWCNVCVAETRGLSRWQTPWQVSHHHSWNMYLLSILCLMQCVQMLQVFVCNNWKPKACYTIFRNETIGLCFLQLAMYQACTWIFCAVCGPRSLL